MSENQDFKVTDAAPRTGRRGNRNLPEGQAVPPRPDEPCYPPVAFSTFLFPWPLGHGPSRRVPEQRPGNIRRIWPGQAHHRHPGHAAMQDPGERHREEAKLLRTCCASCAFLCEKNRLIRSVVIMSKIPVGLVGVTG